MKTLYTLVLSILIVAIQPFSFVVAQSQKDTIPNIIKVWNIDYNDMSIDSFKIDTGLTDIQSKIPLFNDKYFPLWVGNYGLPYRAINRISNINCQNPFMDNMMGYTLNSKNQLFYNTRKPLSGVTYINSGGKDAKGQVISLLHTQNINKDVNVGFRVFYNNSLGNYKNQEVKNSSIGIWTSIQKQRYELYASVNYNKFKSHENGGFLNDSIFESGTFDDSKYIEVNLQDAMATNYYYEADVIHSLNLISNDSLKDTRLVKDFKLVHNARFSKTARAYTDNDPSSGFYHNIYNDSILTSDSTGVNSFYNYIYLEGRSKSDIFNIRAGTFNSIENYSLISNDSLLVFYGFKGGFDFNFGNMFKGYFSSQLIFNGIYQGDTKTLMGINYKVLKRSNSPVLGFNVCRDKESSKIYMNNYSSNNFIWENDFKKMTTNTFEASLQWPLVFSKATLIIGNVNEYLYFNENSFPEQYKGAISFYSAELSTFVPLSNFHFESNILFQNNDNNLIMPVPEFNFKGSISYSWFMFKKALNIGIGIDANYFSSYYAPAFMPALGVFYNQSEKEIGDYPYVDVSINAKIRNFRLLLKYSHINQGLTSQSYYSAFNFAAPPRRFTFGISWMFYD